MATLSPPAVGPEGQARYARRRLNLIDARANRALRILSLLGGLLVFATLIAVVYQIISGASTAYDKFGFGFIGHKTWVPAANQFGALTFIYGTLVTGVTSLVLATVLGVSIGLLLALIAPPRVSAVVGPLVEMLAAIPSVVLGLIGIALIGPFVSKDLEPLIHGVLGFLPIFGVAEPVGNSIFTASLVLTIMVVPIIAALSRDLFRTVPQDLCDGAEALGATRWEMIRAVVLPTTQSGIVAACVLGFGRAIGEAIAVSQVVGNVPTIHADLFQSGDTSAALLANEFPSPVSALHTSAMFYLAAILLVLGITTNMVAQRVSSRFGRLG